MGRTAGLSGAIALGLALLAGCTQKSPAPQASTSAALDARLASDEARIAALESRLTALEAARAQATQAPGPAAAPGFVLTVTTKPEDGPASRVRTRFDSRAACESARAQALADAAERAKEIGQAHVQNLPGGGAMITPPGQPPAVTAVCEP